MYIFINKKDDLKNRDKINVPYITKEDFINELYKIHKRERDSYNEDTFSENDINYYIVTEIPTVKQELDKFIFNDENCYVDNEDLPVVDESQQALVGVHTINGITFLGCMAGGDWEYPIFFMIYWDGKDFRAYVPYYGNVINLDFNAAFGSEADSHNYESMIRSDKYLSLSKDLNNFDIYYLEDEIMDCYCKQQGIELKADSRVVVDFDGIKEDILNNISVHQAD